VDVLTNKFCINGFNPLMMWRHPPLTVPKNLGLIQYNWVASVAVLHHSMTWHDPPSDFVYLITECLAFWPTKHNYTTAN